MTGQEEIKRVFTLISRWLSEIRTNNAVDYYDINKLSEGMAVCLLNDIYGYRLEDLNYERRHYPGIDLGDKEKKIAFQITSRNDSSKIRECLDKFVKKHKKIYSNGIRFLILNQEKPKISKKYNRIYDRFDPTEHILTDKDLMKDIEKIYWQDRDRFRRIRGLLEVEFGDDKRDADDMNLHWKLFQGARKYYRALRGVNGRFKHIMIADIILPKTLNDWIDTRVVLVERKEMVEEEGVFEEKREYDIVNGFRTWIQARKEMLKLATLLVERGMGKTIAQYGLLEDFEDENLPPSLHDLYDTEEPEVVENSLWKDEKYAVFLKNGEEERLNVLDSLKFLWKKDCKHAVLEGEGGMGKTVSLIRLWEAFTSTYNRGMPVPVYIALNEFNEFYEKKRVENFILWMIKNNYGLTNVTEELLWQLMEQPLKKNNEGGYVPSLILLLDGFNEITVEKKDLLVALGHIIEKCHGVQVVISSRYDMRSDFNWIQFNLVKLLDLEDNQVIEYLQGVGVDIPCNNKEGNFILMNRLLKNPMMLTLYASTCEVVESNRVDRNFEFKRHVETSGELMWNFIEAQVKRIFDRREMAEGDKWFYKFLLKFMLPAVGFEMERAGRFEFQREELFEIIKKYCHRFSDEEFFLCFPGYEEYEDALYVGKCDDGKEWRNKRSRIVKVLSKNLSMIVKEADSFRFLHQSFRDFFAAIHLLNELSIELRRDKVPQALKERTLPIYLLRYMGEVESEHYCTPILVEDKGWKIKKNKESRLSRALDLCRGYFDKSFGYTVWNILETWKEVRGELSGADLTRLDLTKVTLNGAICSRLYEDNCICATFDGCRVDEKNFFPQGHYGTVNSAVYSPCGKKVLSASSDGTIKEWDIYTGECLKTFVGHSAGVYSAIYNSNGTRILSASEDKTIKEWDVFTGKCLKTITGNFGRFYSAIYGKDDKKILSAPGNYAAIVEWDAVTGECLNTFTIHSGTVLGASYSLEGKKILSCSWDHTIKECDTTTGQCLKTFVGHSKEVNHAVYSLDGKKVLSASSDETIKEWDISTEKCLKTFTGHSGKVNRAFYSLDGTKMLSASSDGTIKEWDVFTGRCLKTFTGHAGGVKSAFYSLDSTKMLSASSDETIKEWDFSTGQCIKTIKGHSSIVTNAVYSQDGDKILFTSEDSTIKEWSISTRKFLKIFNGHSKTVKSAVYSPDGTKILSVSLDKTIKEWDVSTGQCLKTFVKLKFSIENAVYSPDGQKILAVSNYKIINEWSISTGKCLKNLTGYGLLIGAVYSSDGQKILAITMDYTIEEWDVATNQYVKTYETDASTLNKYMQKRYDQNYLLPAGNEVNIMHCETGVRLLAIKNVPGLFIQDCSFKNLHPESNISKENRELLKQYGAKLELF